MNAALRAAMIRRPIGIFHCPAGGERGIVAFLIVLELREILCAQFPQTLYQLGNVDLSAIGEGRPDQLSISR